MSLIYSHRGFPVVVPVVQGAHKVFERPEIGDIYLERRRQEPPSFEEELDQVVTATKVWVESGNLFANVLIGDVVLSPSARSFVMETAKAVVGIQRRRIGFPDWDMLLEGNSERAVNPMWSKEEKTLLEHLSALRTEKLIQHWITSLSVDDLIQTLFLYVGPNSLID